MSIYNPQFSYGTQEDCHEFLAYLLDMIHEDLNRVKKKPILTESEVKGRTVEEQAADSWKQYLLRNKSIIVDLFQGQTKSSLKCLECNYVSDKYEPFMYLSLPVPEGDDDDTFSLVECLKEYSKEERLEEGEKWYCPKCKDIKESTKKIEIWKLPNILIIHFKRFKFTRHKRCKIRSCINFPIYDFDLTNIVASKQRDVPIYDLFAISNHQGTLGRGHYTCAAKNRDDNEWYSFSDSQVQKVDQTSKLVTSSAYLIFYSKTSNEYIKRQTISRPEYWPHFLRKSTAKEEVKVDDENHYESPYGGDRQTIKNKTQLNTIANQNVKINSIQASP